jgi:phosphoglycerate dehydrogenase-like enzyme
MGIAGRGARDMAEPFRIAYGRDFLKADGSVGFGDIGQAALDAAPGITWGYLDERLPEVTPEQLDGLDGLVLLGGRVTKRSLEGADRLAIIARFGVGYDNVDIAACTEAGVVVTITPDGVRRPMASTILTFILALAHRLVEKDRITRAGDGFARKLDYMGTGLTGRTVGVIGAGNIGKEFFRLAQPFEMALQAHDPYVTQADVAHLGVQMVDLETLLRTSDFVAVNCPLTAETRRLINAERLAMMKPTAYLVSTARGPIVDQVALTEALMSGRIAGAALDVFEEEPVDPDDPILRLDNVIVAPHALCWTDEMARGNGASIIEALLDVASGRNPRYPVDRAVLEHPLFVEKLRRRRETP